MICNHDFGKIIVGGFYCSKFDLYSKADAMPDAASLIPYYQQLIDKYIPGKLKW
jgi:hypothetical protein